MLRQIIYHETEADLANEAAIVDEMAPLLGFHSAIKLDKYHVLDRALLWQGSYMGMLEAKQRDLKFGFGGRGDGYWIAMNKLFAALRWREAARLPTWLAVRFDDGVIRWTSLRGPYRVVHAGRHDRPDDPMAIEPLAVVPWEDWREIKIENIEPF